MKYEENKSLEIDNDFNNTSAVELEEMINSSRINIPLEKINSMNIVLNDGDCSDALFNSVCDRLRNEGLNFKTTKNEEGLKSEDGVIITLDQQYSSGSSTIIFAPYNNSQLGNSDSLALSMKAAFEQNGFLDSEVVCGKNGYRTEVNGDVTRNIPTNTEEVLETSNDSSFVTISLGTQNSNTEAVTKSLKSALARQIYYLEHYDSNTDLIYRASYGESLEEIAKYFGSNVSALKSCNKFNNSKMTGYQAIINPNIVSVPVFSKDVIFELESSKDAVFK